MEIRRRIRGQLTDLNSPAENSVPPVANGAPVSPTPRFELFVTIGILLALLMGALDNFVALTALPKILIQFGQPNSGTFVISAYVIATTASIPIFAKLSDIWSRRNVFLGGLAVFIIGSILSGVSQNLNELILFRAIQGFGSGGFFPVGIAIVAVVFPPKTRARVIGALSGVFGIAVVAGPLIGSAIVQYTTWRWVFYVNIPIGLAGFAFIVTTLGPLRPELVRKFDVVGAALLVGWVAAVMYPLYQIVDSGWAWTSLQVIGLLGLGSALVIVFVIWEHQAMNPLVPIQLFRHRVMAAGGGATFFIGMVFFPVATFLSLVVGVVLAPGSNRLLGNRPGHPLLSSYTTRHWSSSWRTTPDQASLPDSSGRGSDHRNHWHGHPDWTFCFDSIVEVCVWSDSGRRYHRAIDPYGLWYRPDLPGLSSGCSESGANGRCGRSWRIDTIPSIIRGRGRVVCAGFVPSDPVFVA